MEDGVDIEESSSEFTQDHIYAILHAIANSVTLSAAEKVTKYQWGGKEQTFDARTLNNAMLKLKPVINHDDWRHRVTLKTNMKRSDLIKKIWELRHVFLPANLPDTGSYISGCLLRPLLHTFLI